MWQKIFLLLILLGALWAVNKANKIQYVDIKREDVFINDTVINEIDQGTSNMKGTGILRCLGWTRAIRN